MLARVQPIETRDVLFLKLEWSGRLAAVSSGDLGAMLEHQR